MAIKSHFPEMKKPGPRIAHCCSCTFFRELKHDPAFGLCTYGGQRRRVMPEEARCSKYTKPHKDEAYAEGIKKLKEKEREECASPAQKPAR